ncbi:DNA repair protein RecN [Rhodospirillum centenum]|uniref:DNA repair protein RecN n=1 Tax=Rhodospirillum centenum (strain ATCC 51521 / SW) TaxID=414684 RepID=B6IRF3_RHOCS|nr:DNA repair protein RecN [Rhodospirillum centenum]ACI98039.1 DNA repair protein RecN, putative [Rhodospirillum centenum SW]
MLVTLSIRDVVLIDRLTLAFRPGLCVLTGETGAGKSILLDALGLALGARGDSALVRHGAEQAAVTAEFDLSGHPDHPALGILREQELEAEDTLVLRRTVSADGRSRAFVNDQPVGVTLLRRLGETLVEVHGQFDTHGLLDPRTHLGLLDEYAGLGDAARATAGAWRDWRQADQARQQAAEDAARARAEEEYLRHAVAELDSLDPREGEEAELAEKRVTLQHRERLIEAINGAHAELSGDRGAERGLAASLRLLARIADKAGGRLDPVIQVLDEAAAEVAEAARALQALSADIDLDGGSLETIEERLFALRAAARKHSVEVDGLAGLRAEMARRLALIEDQGDLLQRLAKQAEDARTRFAAAARELSAARAKAAGRLDRAVAAELAPLKLEKARFVTRVAPTEEAAWGPHGIDDVSFTVATNPGAPPGPLAKIASGGELARFMLALKVVLAQLGTVPTLVFDEVDTGIGGAVADAVGERLARLGRALQVLVVTHSPQVAARGGHHWQVRKKAAAGRTVTEVAALDAAQRREEIARMLSGAEVTDAARAAADSLLAKA